jgi:hypothetical protein
MEKNSGNKKIKNKSIKFSTFCKQDTLHPSGTRRGIKQQKKK